MKNATLMLATAAFAFGLATQSWATPSPNLSLSNSGLVYGQDKCKEGEKWDEAMKKCVKSDG
ncbi:hypothetical protein MnTg02_00800 [bacterium MnTg02]|nr:hypothetical protein MnTg02_00800 [bacterium MnTg02]